MVRGWVWAAIGSVLLGLLAHDNAAIYGIPLLAALHLRSSSGAELRNAYLPAALLAGAIVLIAASHIAFTTASTQDIVHSVLQSQPPSKQRDFAAYVAVSGARGIATSLCRSMGRAATPFYLAWALSIIAVYAWLLRMRLKEKTVLPYALITVLPFIAVSLVAIDYGRWLTYAVLNAWLFAAGTIRSNERHVPQEWNSVPRIVVLSALIAMRPSHIQLPNYFAKVVAERMWSQKATRERPTEECDPSWRTSIGLPPAPEYPLQETG
jgi:hypothetical protein